MPETPRRVEYRPVPGCHGYRVGDDGTVESCRVRGVRGRLADGRWRRLRPTRDSRRGYLRVEVAGRGTVFVHHLVLEAFVGPRPPGAVCEFADGDGGNAALANLSWVTTKEKGARRRKSPQHAP